MKKALLTLILLGLIITGGLHSQSPPFPNGGNDPGGATPVGGASPLEGGILILISLGVGYSFRKLYSMHIENRERAES
jgi:hypothetical protein